MIIYQRFKIHKNVDPVPAFLPHSCEVFFNNYIQHKKINVLILTIAEHVLAIIIITVAYTCHN